MEHWLEAELRRTTGETGAVMTEKLRVTLI